ncbi:hypothetical protein THAOC_18928 [Thalassiosira oceanica]|uniref:Uncharacterized protein n=1 Tax=Thalassiosira oceanica TaxID=159749 RepID=K0SI61_THAOC|nr:hypothetical protein THAOC_18928 [Thalassiosira oceanica]|eukprot:EJK60676.1 hypothetical protein THAOC_18928 [Thalassiosira oceanica]
MQVTSRSLNLFLYLHHRGRVTSAFKVRRESAKPHPDGAPAKSPFSPLLPVILGLIPPLLPLFPPPPVPLAPRRSVDIAPSLHPLVLPPLLHVQHPLRDVAPAQPHHVRHAPKPVEVCLGEQRPARGAAGPAYAVDVRVVDHEVDPLEVKSTPHTTRSVQMSTQVSPLRNLWTLSSRCPWDRPAWTTSTRIPS